MDKPKAYEILKGLPVYGSMHISITENNESYFSEGFVVRFFKNDNSNWVANFKPGWTGYNEIIEIENHSNLIVIAGGTFYLMNPENEKPFEVFGVGFERSIKNNSGDIILQDNTNLTIIGKDGKYWTTERISYDGIKELKINGKIVTGLSYTPTSGKELWEEFKLDIETREIKGGSFGRNSFFKFFR